MITDEELAEFGLARCGDASCIFGGCGGMSTNGGCQCFEKDEHRWPSEVRRSFRALAFLARKIAAERDLLRGA